MTQRTTISMSDEQYEQLMERQRETGASTSEIIRRALRLYLDQPQRRRLVYKKG